MKASWFRRATQAVACAGALTLLAACGSGSVVSDLEPKRFLTVGDSFMDVGQAGGTRYTVNDGTNNWVQELASHYSQPVTAASAGGFAYAQGHARVAAADPAGAPSVTAQIDTLLASTTLNATDDVVIVNGGMHDIVAAYNATGISEATTKTVRDAGKALAEQVRRLVNAGGKHVAVAGVPLLGNSPWGRGTGHEDAVNTLSIDFNTARLTNIVDLGANVLYLDSAFFFDLMYDEPQNYQFDNGKEPVCTTPDASTCTPATVVSPDYNRWLFADGVHFTPRALQHFGSDRYGENAYHRFKNRW